MNRGLVVFLLALFAGAVALLAKHQSDLDDVPRQGSPDRPDSPLHAPWVEFVEELEGCGTVPPRGLLWLVRRQNDDGSWGTGPAELEGRPLGKAGLTALVALAFTGGGHTPLDQMAYSYEGGVWCLGRELGRAFDWLRRDQAADGTFRSSRDPGLDQAIGAFAFSLLYGATERAEWKPPAQAALDALIRMQKPDGTWEGAAPTAWALLALFDARVSGLAIDAGAVDRALRAQGYPGHPGRALARILGKDDAGAVAYQLVRESAERDPRNVAWWHLATVAVFVADGPRRTPRESRNGGRTWEAWTAVTREKFIRSMNRDWSWQGTSETDSVVRTALGQLALEAYYQYTIAVSTW